MRCSCKECGVYMVLAELIGEIVERIVRRRAEAKEGERS